jgi:diguanylate cyclase (GGDEF)-like protein
LVSLLGGLVAYAAVNMTLIVTAIVLSGPNRSLAGFRQVLGHGDDAVLEFATLSMGALTAGAMATFGPGYALLVLPPLIILHRAVLVRQLEEEANTDSKTGLLNATAWDIEADRAVRRIERLDGNATVLLLDLDNFKQVNDEHGHLIGDQVLAAVAAAIRDVVRDDDLVGRFGGEEFVVLLPAPDGDPGRIGAEAVANRIRRRIEELRIEVPTSHGDIEVGDLSVSIGGATSPADGTQLNDLLKVADAAMYAAKDAGRNRVVMGLRTIRPTGAVDSDRLRSRNDSRAAGH